MIMAVLVPYTGCDSSLLPFALLLAVADVREHHRLAGGWEKPLSVGVSDLPGRQSGQRYLSYTRENRAGSGYCESESEVS